MEQTKAREFYIRTVPHPHYDQYTYIIYINGIRTYTSQDASWIEELANRLDREGYAQVPDPWE